MRKAKSAMTALAIVFAVGMLLVSSALAVDNVCIRDDYDQAFRNTIPPSNTEYGQSRGQNYGGALKVFLVEPEGRWNDYSGKPFKNALLKFSVDVPLDMVPFQVYTWVDTSYWYGTTETNIMTVAAIYNGEGHVAYSVPPSGNPFTAHYADAVTWAFPGETNDNTPDVTGYTHKVIVEEATTST